MLTLNNSNTRASNYSTFLFIIFVNSKKCKGNYGVYFGSVFIQMKCRHSKTKKTHGFKSCIMISVYPLDKPSIKKATEYRNN